MAVEPGLKTLDSDPISSESFGPRTGAGDNINTSRIRGVATKAARRTDQTGVHRFRRGYRSSAGHAEAPVLVKPEQFANLTANDENYALAA